jgi:hypothetical protein
MPPVHRSTRVTMSDGSVVAEVWEHRTNEICECDAVGLWVNVRSEHRLCTECRRGWHWGETEQSPDNPALEQIVAQLERAVG